jgi:hypothetical protein
MLKYKLLGTAGLNNFTGVIYRGGKFTPMAFIFPFVTESEYGQIINLGTISCRMRMAM